MAAALTKAELVESIALGANLSKKQAAGALDAFIAAVEQAVAEGKVVRLMGFGSFQTRVRRAMRIRNIATGQFATIPERRVVVFRPGTHLKESAKGV